MFFGRFEGCSTLRPLLAHAVAGRWKNQYTTATEMRQELERELAETRQEWCPTQPGARGGPLGGRRGGAPAPEGIHPPVSGAST